MGSKGARSIRGVSVLVCILGVLVCGCAGKGARVFEATDEPVIAVLCQFSQEVVLLDPDDLREIERIGLTSQSLEFEARGRQLVTAQTGGHGDEAGREYGVIDLEVGSVAYHRLGSIDIQSVAVTRPGWLMLTTGLVGPKGQWLHRVSVDGGVDDLFVSAGISGLAATRDRVWVSHFWDDETGHPADRYLIYGETGDPTVVTSEMTRTVSLCGSDDAVVAFGYANDRTRLVRHDAQTGEVLATAWCEGFEAGPSWAWSAGPYIALADGPAEDYFLATRLVVFDAVTLESVGSVDVEGVSAVCEAPDGRLVVCEGNGDVSLVDPVSFEKVVSKPIGDSRGDMVDVEIVP